MRKTAIAAYAVMDYGPAMIRRIKALDASKTDIQMLHTHS